MAMSFACPSCKKVLKSNVALPVGKVIKCPACQTPFAIPSDDAAEAAAPPPVPEPAAAAQSSMFDMVRPAGAASPPPPAPAPAAPQTMPAVESLPEQPEELDEAPEQLDEADDDSPRKKKKKGSDDDEVEDLDDEDDTPRKKKKKGRDDDEVDDLDDEDDGPRKKKKKGGADDEEDDSTMKTTRRARRKKAAMTTRRTSSTMKTTAHARRRKKAALTTRRTSSTMKTTRRARRRKAATAMKRISTTKMMLLARRRKRAMTTRRTSSTTMTRGKKKKGRDDDEDDDDDRPRKRGKKGKKSAVNKKVLIMAGAGVGGVAVLGLLIWLGSSLFTGGGGGAALSYMPPDSDEIWGVNFSALENASYKKTLLLMFPMPEDDFESIMHGSNRLSQIVVVQSKKAVDPEKLRKGKMGFLDSAETLEGRTVYRDRERVTSPYSRADAMFSPSSRMLVTGKVSEIDLKHMLNGTQTQVSRDMQTQVRNVQGNALWSVISLDSANGRMTKMMVGNWLYQMKNADKKPNFTGDPKEIEKQMEEQAKEMADLLSPFKEVKTLTFTASTADPKTLRIEAKIDFANEADAKKIEKIVAAKETIKTLGSILPSAGGMRIGQPKKKGMPDGFDPDGGLNMSQQSMLPLRVMSFFGERARADLDKSLEAKLVGNTLVIGATLTDETFKKFADEVERRDKQEKQQKLMNVLD